MPLFWFFSKVEPYPLLLYQVWKEGGFRRLLLGTRRMSHSPTGTQIHAAQAMEGQQARVVIVTCKLPLDNPRALVWRDLNFKTRPYSSPGAYTQSKIALAVWGSDLANRCGSALQLVEQEIQGSHRVLYAPASTICPPTSTLDRDRPSPYRTTIYLLDYDRRRVRLTRGCAFAGWRVCPTLGCLWSTQVWPSPSSTASCPSSRCCMT